jgi:hypothetical protein
MTATHGVKGGKFVVVCVDYRLACKTLEAAKHQLAAIEKHGACRNAHHIEEVVR